MAACWLFFTRSTSGFSAAGLALLPFDSTLDPTPDNPRIGFDGAVNFWLLAGVAALVLLSGLWTPGVVFNIAGTDVGLPGLARDAGLVLTTLLSPKITAAQVHADNQFSWGPMLKVGKFFAGVFLTIIPVIAMFKVGANGPFGAVVLSVTQLDGTPNPVMYFWATGILSAFLDNAPTLATISAGAVFMDALTCIDNASNPMVKAIAEERGVKMPSFLGYMVSSGGVLILLFILMSFIWFK